MGKSFKLANKQRKMKVLVSFALFALIGVVMGDDHADGMVCEDGFVKVEMQNGTMGCVECKDTIQSSCSAKTEMCPIYAEKNFCTDARYSKYLQRKCPVSCGLCKKVE